MFILYVCFWVMHEKDNIFTKVHVYIFHFMSHFL